MPELDLGVADVAAKEQLVSGGGLAVGPPLGPVETDVGDVVLAAAVGAAGDVDADPAHVGQPGLLQSLADGVGEAPALGHGQVAGVGPGAGDDVASQLGAGFGHADGVQPPVQLRQLVGGQAPEGQVLAVGDPDVDPEVPHDGGQGPELLGGDVAQPGVGDGRHRALGHADDHVRRLPPGVGIRPWR